MILRLILISIAAGLGMYYAAGLFFEIAYYRRRRADAATWKSQPGRFPAAHTRRREMALGTLNMTTTSIASALFIYAVQTHGITRVYFDVAAHGWAWTLLAAVLYFFAVDLLLYGAHRAYHHPVLFRYIHRWHHRFIAPTAFAAAATHPVELHSYHLITLVPLFLFPVHAVAAIGVLLYTNYLALIDHSGVKLWSIWPWQGPTRFHDDHHVHFHVNFGQNLSVWDRFFGTYRRQGRRYGEEVFGGRGESMGGTAAGTEPLFDYSRDADAAEAAVAQARPRGQIGDAGRTDGRPMVAG